MIYTQVVSKFGYICVKVGVLKQPQAFATQVNMKS